MSEDNLTLWNSVEKTDPTHVKAITGKKYKGNSPKPHYLIHKATKVFGPCGIGWGFTVLSERIEQGIPGESIHIAHVRVWYIWEGKTGHVEHFGGTPFTGKYASGPFTDEDAPKKSVTDALVKALSCIGFAGDIFLGRWDDSKYVDNIGKEFEAEKRGKNTKAAKQEPPKSPASEGVKYENLNPPEKNADPATSTDYIGDILKDLEFAAAHGLAKYREAWESIGAENRKALAGEHPRLKKMAQDRDANAK